MKTKRDLTQDADVRETNAYHTLFDKLNTQFKTSTFGNYWYELGLEFEQSCITNVLTNNAYRAEARVHPPSPPPVEIFKTYIFVLVLTCTQRF